MKILVALIHPEEWNQYIPFNGYISTIKNNYDYVIGVVAEKPLILLSEVDECYTITDGLCGTSYPSILDTSSRENHQFINKCVEQIKQDFSEDELTFISWQKTAHHTGIIDIHSRNPSEVYRTSFGYAQVWYKLHKTIQPTEKTFINISKKYGHLFDDKTFILLSRNFKNKSPIHNSKTCIINFEPLLDFLVNNGIRIINIGFPPANCNIINDNYVELNLPLTQDELFSLFYLSRGVILGANAGGFVSHLSSNNDMFTLTDEWKIPPDYSIFELIKHKVATVDTIPLHNKLKLINTLDVDDDFGGILEILNNHKTKRILNFDEPKKITYV